MDAGYYFSHGLFAFIPVHLYVTKFSFFNLQSERKDYRNIPEIKELKEPQSQQEKVRTTF